MSEEAMKYNVGDKVYAIGSLYFLGNPYHFKKALGSFHAVKVADKHRFSTGNRNLSDVCGMDLWEVNFQADGRPMYSDRVLLHVEKDRDAIVSEIDRVINAFLEKAEKQKQEKLASCRAKIKALHDEIEDIEKYGVTFGFSSIRMVDFITENKNTLLEKLKP